MKSSYFDKYTVFPKPSSIERGQVNLRPISLGNLQYQLPILSSPMDSVTGIEMINAMNDLGCGAVMHRYLSEEEFYKLNVPKNTIIAIGSINNHKDRIVRLIDNGYTYLMVDTAHGAHIKSLKTYEFLATKYPEVYIISGSICTKEAAILCFAHGAHAFRVGVSPGQHCATFENLGIGRNLIDSVKEIKSWSTYIGINIPIIADGGLRGSADLHKILVAGASYGMFGTLFGATLESASKLYVKIDKNSYKEFTNEEETKLTLLGANLYKKIRGMASLEALIEGNGKDKNNAMVEGISSYIKVTGSVKDLVNSMKSNLEQFCYYTGSDSVENLIKLDLNIY
jgi:IMP dehydrogenase